MAALRRFLLLPIALIGIVYESMPYSPPQGNKSIEAERDRAYTRQQFQQNFKNLQTTGQRLLREHEASTLTAARLAKDARAIHKYARTLRAMQALGEMARPTELNKEIDTAKEFDESIRKLAKLIWEFAHNPVHQSSKVFNTDQAERAQTDLLTIINLSKALESKSKGYTPAPMQSN
ncbi:MAG: hypothetical protein ACREEM_14945 [Blastocatellia bacterium]